ncbi:hypothetical protein M569_02687, partial [Genlisea aurea]
MASRKRSLSNDADMSAQQKEWDEASCPICLDHPHNAVLIICSSHDKGCRSFICDTSYRHSNCLDRFKKLKQDNIELPATSSISGHDHDSVNSSSRRRTVEFEDQEGALFWERLGSGESNTEKSAEQVSLRCPLCRGNVLGWKVVEDVRKYLNLKPRSCSRESCSFTGNYGELRRHARKDHPTVCPADVDPSRQREWQHLEDQRELNDIVSAIRSAMPGAILVGDYAIESSGDRPSRERIRSENAAERGRWLSTLFLFQMIGALEDGAPRRGGRSRGHRRAEQQQQQPVPAVRHHHYLWGENLLGLQDEAVDEEDEVADEEENGEESEEQDLNVPSDLGDNRRRR